MRATPASTTRKSAAKSATPDAVKLLTADHAEVKALFKKYDKLAKGEGSDADKAELAATICDMLSVHAQIEEEIFYPAAREVMDEHDLLDEADVEHASAKDLIAQLEASGPEDDDHYDAKVKVLGEYVDHHVKEEQDELFKAAKKAGMDMEAVGEQLAARKAELMAERGLVD